MSRSVVVTRTVDHRIIRKLCYVVAVTRLSSLVQTVAMGSLRSDSLRPRPRSDYINDQVVADEEDRQRILWDASVKPLFAACQTDCAVLPPAR